MESLTSLPGKYTLFPAIRVNYWSDTHSTVFLQGQSTVFPSAINFRFLSIHIWNPLWKNSSLLSSIETFQIYFINNKNIWKYLFDSLRNKRFYFCNLILHNRLAMCMKYLLIMTKKNKYINNKLIKSTGQKFYTTKSQLRAGISCYTVKSYFQKQT